MDKKKVKDFEEAAEAIDNIVNNAKIPIISMVAILETVKAALLHRHMSNQDLKQSKQFFDKLQQEAERKTERKGVS